MTINITGLDSTNIDTANDVPCVSPVGPAQISGFARLNENWAATANAWSLVSEDTSTAPVSVKISGSLTSGGTVGFNWHFNGADHNFIHTISGGDSFSVVTADLLAQLKANSAVQALGGLAAAAYIMTTTATNDTVVFNQNTAIQPAAATSSIITGSPPATVTITGGDSSIDLNPGFSLGRLIPGRAPQVGDSCGVMGWPGQSGAATGLDSGLMGIFPVLTQVSPGVCVAMHIGTAQGTASGPVSYNDRLIIGAGVYTPSAVGGDKGQDTVNAKHFYKDGVEITGGAGSSPGGSNGQVQYNNSGSFGGLTAAQLTADISTFTSTLSGAVPASGGGTSNFMRADGTWAAPSGSGATNGVTASLTRDASSASGTQSITGLSFQPKSAIFVVGYEANARPGICSFGSSDGTNNICWFNTSSSFNAGPDGSNCIYMTGGSGNIQQATCMMNSDGLTLHWTKTGTPLTGTLYIQCILNG